MSLSNIDADRVLMLLEEAIAEDKEIAQIMKRFSSGLKKCWRSKAFCDEATDKVRVAAWTVEQTYVFETADKQQIYKQSNLYGHRCVTEVSYLAKMPTKVQLEGLSISDIEEISDKFNSPDTPIKCLLDAGFSLELIVPRSFLGL